MTEALLSLSGGLVLLVVGGSALVRGAAALAMRLGVTPLAIGLTVVAFGTSAPELAVSVTSAWSGNPSLAVGNVVGSNVCNILLILGVSALITPMIVSRELVRREVPLMIGVSLATWLFAADGVLARWEAAILVASGVAYTAYLMVSPATRAAAAEEQGSEPGANALSSLAFIAGGLAALVLGSRWLVSGAVTIARGLGVDEVVIGLTVVAVGTSLPEIVTSVVAALKGERDLAVGNVVGSNIFNLLIVLGVAGVVSPAGGMAVSDSLISFDFAVMVAVAFACLPIFFSGFVVSRVEGALFISNFIAYTAYLVLDAKQHSLAEPLAMSLVFVVLPISIALVSWGVWRHVTVKR